jgi:hypothetical protein
VPADDEEALPLGDPEQEAGGAGVAVGHPHVLLDHRLQDGVEEGPLLGVPVLTRDHVDGQSQGRVEDHQRLPRQRSGDHVPEWRESPLGLAQVVAVEHLHPAHDRGHQMDARGGQQLSVVPVADGADEQVNQRGVG